MRHVAVLDYGVGNVKSIMNALATLPCQPLLTRDPAKIASSDKIILPGVGAFAHCMERFCHYGLHRAVQSAVAQGKALLGICVGMQILFESSEEYGETEGLGLIAGTVRKLPITIDADHRLPHIGWNEVSYRQGQAQPVFSDLPRLASYYFVHSYACNPKSDNNVLAQTRYAGVDFVAAVVSNNICGVQYHPERSGKAGLELLRNFVA